MTLSLTDTFSAHSLALKNDGTVVAWGGTNAGQTTVPSWLGPVKLIGAGGNQSLVSRFSPLVQYPVDVTKDLLLIYNNNANSTNSVFIKDYYLAHRPMVSGANVLGVDCPGIFVASGGNNTFMHITNTRVYETVTYNDFSAQIQAPLQTWLNNHPTKRPQYVILFLDVPSRIDGLATDASNYPFCSDGKNASVSVRLASSFSGWSPFVTHINMDGTNDCIAYINKLASFGRGAVIISASAGGYGNTNYYFDNTERGVPITPNVSGVIASNAVVQAGACPAAVIYTNVTDNSVADHLTRGINVTGYECFGMHGTLGPSFPTNGDVQWSGNSGWWIIETVESYNGQRFRLDYSTPIAWFSQGAFGGNNYANTPVAAVSYTEEPGGPYVNHAGRYFSLWQAGKSFGICAWNSRLTDYFQAVGDPLVAR
ncbi:MAG: hypothetical protein NT154_02125 [Verrucomicrobia bacterium]|nr:hypothetical protein [Verrucomicrobiota bacterium]